MQSTTNDRRTSPRYKTHLTFRVMLPTDEKNADGTLRSITLSGHTHDISPEGLALVGPFVSFGARYLVNNDRPLQVQLNLPSGSVKLNAAAVRFERLDKGEQNVGFIMTGPAEFDQNIKEMSCLIGVRILKIADQDRIRYLEYLTSLGWTTS